MVSSIFLYLFWGIVFFGLGKKDMLASENSLSSNNTMTSYSWFFVLVFTLISGLRFNLGADCESYVHYFQVGDFSEFTEKREYVFAYVSQAIRNLGMGRVAFLGFWAFIEIFFLYKSLVDRKFLLPFFGLVMMLGPYYYDMQNGIRQIVAACIFTFAIQQKIDYDRWKLFLILVLASALIHRSALFLLVFALIPNNDYFRNRYIVLTALFVSVFLGQQGWLLPYLNEAATLIRFDDRMGFEGYLERMDYFTEDLGRVMAYGPRRLLLLFVSILIIWFYPEMQKKYEDKFLMFCFSGFVIYTLFAENLLSAAHSSLSRPFLYLKLFKLICNAYLLVFLKEKYLKDKPLLFYSVLFLSIVYMPIDNIAVAGEKGATTLFKFIFWR